MDFEDGCLDVLVDHVVYSLTLLQRHPLVRTAYSSELHDLLMKKPCKIQGLKDGSTIKSACLLCNHENWSLAQGRSFLKGMCGE